MKKVLIIKSNNNDFERFYSRKMSEEKNIEVYSYEDIFPQYLSPNINILKKIFYGLGKIFLWKKWLKEYQQIIVFDYCGRNILMPLWLAKSPHTDMYVWEWNTLGKINKNLINRLLEYMAPVFTFDKGDAEANSWKYISQFYFTPAISSSISFSNNSKDSNSIKKDSNSIKNKKAFFVGFDKGRLVSLVHLRNILQDLGIVCNFWIIRDKNTPATYNDIDLKEDFLSYQNVLNYVNEADLVIDFVKDGQNGITIRVLEAIFMGKKIITNNSELLNSRFYDPSRVLIWNNDVAFSKVEKFVNTPMLPYQDDEKEYFSFAHWISEFDK